MAKKTIYTKITPLPRNVPRQLAIEMLHSHQEVIELNPLVTGVKAIDAPRDAPNDEYFSQWYEINEIITWGFGLRKKIAFKGVFHDQPYGLQSHVYAPMGVDLRNKYRIGGNQPGEARETRELGIDTPLDGLYLREDVEIVCNIALASFVKKETKDATGKMIERLARKAELLDEGKLHAMFEDGMLKTAKPSGFSEDESQPSGSMAGTPPGSPGPHMVGFASPRLDKKGYGNYHDVARRNSHYLPPYQQQGYSGLDLARPGTQQTMPMINELPGSYEHPPQTLLPSPLNLHSTAFRSELPGDSSFASTRTPSHSFGSTATPSPQPSPRAPSQSSLDMKPPVQYQAYPPPSQQHPADRDRTNSLTPSHDSHTEHPQPYSRTNIAQWQQSLSNTSQLSLSRNSSTGHSADSYQQQQQQQQQQQSRPSSSTIIVPDHQRFSNLSLQNPSTAPQQSPRTNSTLGDFSQYQSAKCPVCELFEGDEAAVSHHVSQAHFS